MRNLITTAILGLLIFINPMQVEAESDFQARFDDLIGYLGSLIQPYHKTTRSNSTYTQYDRIITQAAKRHNLDPYLVKAIIKHESDFNPYAVSEKGAKGLMQLMPETARELGVFNVWDPEQNIYGGVKYYNQLYRRYDKNHYTALIAYNTGPGNVSKGVVPKVSRIYANNVLKTWSELKKSSQNL